MTIQQMCQDHFNEPVLMYSFVARLIGWGQDEFDQYLILKCLPKTYGGDPVIMRHTAVGGYIWLTNLINQNYVLSSEGEDWDDYYRIDHYLELQGVTKEDTFLIENHLTLP